MSESTKSNVIKEKLKVNPLKYNGVEIKEKLNEKYLGDIIYEMLNYGNTYMGLS